jgi:5-methylcytosine-specific restriction protein A
MPFAPLHPCPRAGCPVLVQKGYCPTHARDKDRTRYNADTRRWYYTKAWSTLRAITLSAEPICVECKTRPSTVVDHKVPHRGDSTRFYDRANLQGMCVTCHGQKTRRGE